jgi:hypothetical protein
MAGEGQKSAPVTKNETPDLKKVLDTADKKEAVSELQRQLNSAKRFEKARELLLKEPELRARMLLFLHDPSLKDKIPEPLRTNLIRILTEREGVVAATSIGLREEMAARGIVPPTAKPGETAADAPPAAQGRTLPAAPPATPPADTSKKPADTGKLLKNVSIAEALEGFINNLSELFASVGQIFSGAGGGGAAVAEKAAEKVAAPKFTEAQLKAIQLALEKNKDTKYPGMEKAAEFVCDALNLPRVDSPQILLDRLKNSEMNGQKLVFDRDISNLKNLKSGDVIFFRKDANQAQPFLCAVVSKMTVAAGQEPRIYIKTIGPGGGQPQEMEMIGDLRSQFYGAVKIPQKIA